MSLAKTYAKAVVTGGSSGLGEAFVDFLLGEGVEVWTSSRRPEKVAGRAGLHVKRLDLTEGTPAVEGFFAECLQEMGQIDLLINNAGYGTFAPWSVFPPEEVDRQLDVLLGGPIALCRLAYGQMQQQSRGTIVNVSSLAVSFPLPFMAMYNTAKAGLSAFSKSLMQESALLGESICVIDLQPGDFNTGFNEGAVFDDEPAQTQAVAPIWQNLRRNVEEGPEVAVAVASLQAALLREKSGVVRTGDWFQSRLAVWALRLFPESWLRWGMRVYFTGKFSGRVVSL